jgi:hypothetical protein
MSDGSNIDSDGGSSNDDDVDEEDRAAATIPAAPPCRATPHFSVPPLPSPTAPPSPALRCVLRKKKSENTCCKAYISSVSDVSEVCYKCFR